MAAKKKARTPAQKAATERMLAANRAKKAKGGSKGVSASSGGLSILVNGKAVPQPLKGKLEKVIRAHSGASATLEPTLWVWNWKGGGYNSCHAPDRDDALRQAKALASRTNLVIDVKTLRPTTQAELNRIDSQYA